MFLALACTGTSWCNQNATPTFLFWNAIPVSKLPLRSLGVLYSSPASPDYINLYINIHIWFNTQCLYIVRTYIYIYTNKHHYIKHDLTCNITIITQFFHSSTPGGAQISSPQGAFVPDMGLQSPKLMVKFSLFNSWMAGTRGTGKISDSMNLSEPMKITPNILKMSSF